MKEHFGNIAKVKFWKDFVYALCGAFRKRGMQKTEGCKLILSKLNLLFLCSLYDGMVATVSLYLICLELLNFRYYIFPFWCFSCIHPSYVSLVYIPCTRVTFLFAFSKALSLIRRKKKNTSQVLKLLRQDYNT